MFAKTVFAAAALAGAVSAHQPNVARNAVPQPPPVAQAAAEGAAEAAAEAVWEEEHHHEPHHSSAPHHEHHHGNGTIVTTTKIVDVLPTYCPDKINYITHNEKVITVEGPTWYTITDCPCTSTYTTECYTCKVEPTKSHGGVKPVEPTGHEKEVDVVEEEDEEEVDVVEGAKPGSPASPESPEGPEGPKEEGGNDNVEVSGAEAMLKQGLLAVGMAVAVGVATFGAAGF